MDKLRIDKWLWCARFFKTRSIAAEEIGKGRVMVNGQTAKASREVRPGDTEETVAERVVKSGSGTSYLARVAEHAPKFIAELDITRKDDGHKFTWDEMQYDSDMQNVITQIAGELTKKYRVGNPKSPS